MAQYAGIPVMLDVTGRRCVIVGGGRVAARRAQTLHEAGADVLVVAPRVDIHIANVSVDVRQRVFEAKDLDDAWLVVVATDDPKVNHAVHVAAKARNVLVNRADDADASDVTFMVNHRAGPLTVAVHTGGASASAAVRIRDDVAAQLDGGWAVLLQHAKDARKRIQQAIDDPTKRTALLRRLTDDTAMHALQSGGESALLELYADIMRGLD